jgi:hypothetical protein
MPAGTYTNLVTNGTNCAVVYHSTGNIYSNGVFSSKSLGGISQRPSRANRGRPRQRADRVPHRHQ